MKGMGVELEPGLWLITRGFSNHFCDTFGNPLFKWRGSLWGTLFVVSQKWIPFPTALARTARSRALFGSGDREEKINMDRTLKVLFGAQTRTLTMRSTGIRLSQSPLPEVGTAQVQPNRKKEVRVYQRWLNPVRAEPSTRMTSLLFVEWVFAPVGT